MDVGLEDVGNRERVLAREVYILFDVTRGIDDNSDARAAVTDQAGKFGDAFGLDAFETIDMQARS